MKQALSALSKTLPKQAAQVRGFVERMSGHQIIGWAYRADGGPVELSLRLDGKAVPTAALTWSSRTDVIAPGTGPQVQAGFTMLVAGGDAQRLQAAFKNKGKVEVLANGRALPYVAGFLRQFSEHAERGPPPRANVEKFSLFTIRGWCINADHGPLRVGVYCAGQPLECAVLRVERRDVAEALHSPVLDLGFEIELSAHVWEQVDAKGNADLEVRANGWPLHAQPLSLNRDLAVQWVTEILGSAEGAERQYRMLLALEHVRHGGLLPKLDEGSRAALAAFAGKMGLAEFLMPVASASGTAVTAPAESASSQLLFKALRSLNARLPDRAPAAFAQVQAVLDELRLKGEPRQRYLDSVIPLLCRTGEFARLRELTDFARLQEREKAENVWEATLALPALVETGQIRRATELLWRLPKLLEGGGWFNTECLRHAVRRAAELEAEGEVDLAEAEKFRFAVIGVLEHFRGAWFSRLHDAELIEAMLDLLAHRARYSDRQRRDITAAALRYYGVDPSFWDRLHDGPGVCAELQRARCEWDVLRKGMDDTTTSPAARLETVAGPLRYFGRQKNPEAVAMLREALMAALPELNRAMTPLGRQLIEELVASDPSEAVRIAAHPVPESFRLFDTLPEVSGQLSATIRGMTRRDRSVVYELQMDAAKALAAAHEASAESPAALRDALAHLESQAMGLANAQGAYLAADLFASAYLLARRATLDGEAELMRLADIVRKAVRTTEAGVQLPTPVCSALNRLQASTRDPLLNGFLREMRDLVCSKFDAHDVFDSVSTSCVLTPAPIGCPEDTLVVVYSCRKYLDSRVQAIRNGWLKDLQDRNIPYVILVGDGGDTLEGDVLALDVSDRYEDLPRKTLKLVEWVYRNTNAQFLFKIDDDCYLDVARYFDTLSYRKHAYYGRVLERAPGSMDRTWHQEKSHSPRARKAIDKSPEPSRYADGGGGYSLSRVAMGALLEAAASSAGQRLASGCFMEDKLVGDLLALGGVHPSNEDYESFQRRRTFAQAMPVAMWENTFFPGVLTPTKVVHLDTEHHQELAREKSASGELWPKKIWPTYSPPHIDPYLNKNAKTNQLELLTSPEAAARLQQEAIVVVAVMRNERVILPHFLAHYRSLGVRCFIIVDNLSDDGTREYLAEQQDVILYSADTPYRDSHYGVAWQQAVLGNLCLGKWVVLADADELLVYEGCETRALASFVAEVEASGADGVRIDMIDMYPYGDLAEADLRRMSPFEAAPWFDRAPLSPWRLGSGWFSNSSSFTSTLRHRLIPGGVPHDFVSQKYALFRYQPWLRLSQGLHYAANLRISDQAAYFAHFKYHADFKAKVEAEIRRGQHFNQAAEYRRYQTMLAETRGAFGCHERSRRYQDSHSFAQGANS